MRKILILVVALVLVVCRPSYAIDNSKDLVSLVRLTPGQATPDRITAILGKPAKIEQGKRKSWWHYKSGTTNVVFCWNKKGDVLEKFSFKNESLHKPIFDGKCCSKLKSGATDIMQAMKLLGVPKDMTVKKMTQEMHYTYQNSVLRLFFRDRVLVDFTLLMQK